MTTKAGEREETLQGFCEAVYQVIREILKDEEAYREELDHSVRTDGLYHAARYYESRVSQGRRPKRYQAVAVVFKAIRGRKPNRDEKERIKALCGS